ncbi:hypothetical protein [Streptomyces sp. NPDC050564]|uniref:hypothetical protein n=1 Tax=Streptomyces sp. NPDC050564 TaxID=3365631 RepID=UPI0037886920
MRAHTDRPGRGLVPAVVTDHRARVGLIVTGMILEVILPPAHLYVVIAARRMTRTLSVNRWRLGDCEIRNRGRTQLPTVEGRVLTPHPFRSYVKGSNTWLGMAGHPHQRRVVSDPGGARSVAVAMSTTDNRSA